MLPWRPATPLTRPEVLVDQVLMVPTYRPVISTETRNDSPDLFGLMLIA